MNRRLKIGWLVAFALVAAGVTAAAGGLAATTAVSKVATVGFASPEKPNDYG